jgi:hypothetical protein
MGRICCEIVLEIMLHPKIVREKNLLDLVT